jgi:hypothetical protein
MRKNKQVLEDIGNVVDVGDFFQILAFSGIGVL